MNEQREPLCSLISPRMRRIYGDPETMWEAVAITQAKAQLLSLIEKDRVGVGITVARDPTDPDLQVSRIRLLP